MVSANFAPVADGTNSVHRHILPIRSAGVPVVRAPDVSQHGGSAVNAVVRTTSCATATSVNSGIVTTSGNEFQTSGRKYQNIEQSDVEESATPATPAFPAFLAPQGIQTKPVPWDGTCVSTSSPRGGYPMVRVAVCGGNSCAGVAVPSTTKPCMSLCPEHHAQNDGTVTRTSLTGAPRTVVPSTSSAGTQRLVMPSSAGRSQPCVARTLRVIPPASSAVDCEKQVKVAAGSQSVAAKPGNIVPAFVSLSNESCTTVQTSRPIYRTVAPPRSNGASSPSPPQQVAIGTYPSKYTCESLLPASAPPATEHVGDNDSHHRDLEQQVEHRDDGRMDMEQVFLRRIQALEDKVGDHVELLQRLRWQQDRLDRLEALAAQNNLLRSHARGKQGLRRCSARDAQRARVRSGSGGGGNSAGAPVSSIFSQSNKPPSPNATHSSGQCRVAVSVQRPVPVASKSTLTEPDPEAPVVQFEKSSTLNTLAQSAPASPPPEFHRLISSSPQSSSVQQASPAQVASKAVRSHRNLESQLEELELALGLQQARPQGAQTVPVPGPRAFTGHPGSLRVDRPSVKS